MPQAAIERSIFFTPFAGPVEGTRRPTSPTCRSPRFCRVVTRWSAPAGQTVDHNGDRLDLNGNGAYDYLTMIGRRHDAGEIDAGNPPPGLRYDQTRRIVLEPHLNFNLHQAQVLGNTDAAFPEPVPPDIQPAVGIVINLPRSLSVTEPVTGYPNYGIDPTPPGPSGEIWDPTFADHEGSIPRR